LILLLLACAVQGPPAGAILDALGACQVLDGTDPFDTDIDEEGNPTGQSVDICSNPHAIWWTADLDIDCDGGSGKACKDDPSYQAETAATTEAGDALDASVVPYVVVPLPWNPVGAHSEDFFWCDRGLRMGGPVAVIYDDVVTYAVIGDEGPVTDELFAGADGNCDNVPYPGGVIGEGSYALAEALGIDPDPTTGGADCAEDGSSCPVTYVLFLEGAVDPIDSPAATQKAGAAAANELVSG
jgi:hypothetical protein